MKLPCSAFLISGTLAYSVSQHILQQPSTPDPAFDLPLRPLEWGKLNILHTTDTHAWYAGHLNQENYGADWGDYISFVQHLHQKADNLGVDLLVVDSGDKHDGNGLSDASEINGEVSTNFFLEQDFDLLSIGNHELYLASSSYQEYKMVVGKFAEKFLAANVEILINNTWTTFGNKFRIFETKNQKLKILSFGFLFNFARFNPQTRVKKVEKVIKESWFHDVLKENIGKIDVILVVGHVPVQIVPDFPELLHIHSAIRKYYPNIIIEYLGGHSHIRDFTYIDDKSVALQSGRYCETVGFLSVDFENVDDDDVIFNRRYIDFNRHSFFNHSNRTIENFETSKGSEISEKLAIARDLLNLTEIFGFVPEDYLVIDNSYPGPGSLYTLLEQNILTRLNPEIKKKQPTSRAVLINSGSIRYDLYKGPFTQDTMFIVSPFQNQWLYLPNVTSTTIRSIIRILNGLNYILASNNKNSIVDLNFNNLSPISKLAYNSKAFPVEPLPNFSNYNLTKGYVTCDDFGCDGDDTPHIPYNYGKDNSPNIIHSFEVSEGNTNQMDLVFYDFLQPYIVYALNEVLGEKKTSFPFKHYGGQTVASMLKEHVEEVWS